jgi:hypothetical protein
MSSVAPKREVSPQLREGRRTGMSSLNLFGRFFMASLLLLLGRTAASAEPLHFAVSAAVGPVGGPMGPGYSVEINRGEYWNFSAYSADKMLLDINSGRFPGLRNGGIITGANYQPVGFSGYAELEFGGQDYHRYSNHGSLAQGLAYTLTVTDLDSGKSGTVTLTWKFQPNGYIDIHGYMRNLPDLILTSPKSQSSLLGDGQMGVSSLAGFYALVDYNTPEPGTLGLAVLGVAGMSLAAWRKRRQRFRRIPCPPTHSVAS